MRGKIIWLTALVPSLSFAFFCPTNFNQITAGQTRAQVTAACGKPDKQESKKVKAEGPQEWSYYVPQSVATSDMTTAQGTLKMQFTFDDSGKAINISVNGIGVGSTTICGNSVSLGDTRDAIKAACGKPSFVNQQNGNTAVLGAAQPSTVMVTFTYNTNPPVTLTFENGKLTGE